MRNVYLISFFVPLIVALVIMPLVIRISDRFKTYDRPDKRRKVHSLLVPRWGGLGIAISIACGLIVVGLFPQFHGRILDIPSLSGQFQGIIAGAIIILVLGMIDDKEGLAPATKLLVQVIAVLVAVIHGVKIAGFSLPGGRYIQFPNIVAIIVSLAWFLMFINAMNLADGLDGLAGGISSISGISFFIISLILLRQMPAVQIRAQLCLSSVFALGMSGATIGFLYYNFYPASIFMGDSGSMLLGFLLAGITCIGTLKTAGFLAVIIPVLVVGLPILDAVFAVCRRLRKKVPMMQADDGHIHHHFVKWGWGHREVVLLMYTLTLGLSVFAIALAALGR